MLYTTLARNSSDNGAPGYISGLAVLDKCLCLLKDTGARSDISHEQLNDVNLFISATCRPVSEIATYCIVIAFQCNIAELISLAGNSGF